MAEGENKPELSGAPSDWWADLWADQEAHEIVLKRKTAAGEETVTTLVLTSNEFRDFEDLVLYVKEHFGGGMFVIYRRGEGGRFLPGSRKQFAIAGAPRKEPDPATATPAQGNGLAEFAALLTRQQEASEARMVAVLEKLTAKPEGEPLEKALGIIAQVQKINAPTRSSLDGLKEFAEFRALMRDLAGEEAAPRSDGFADLLKAALPVLGEVAKSGADVAKVKAAVALKKAQAARPTPPPGPTLPPEVLSQLRQLLELAPVMPSEELAAMVADQLDNEQAQAVVDAIDGHDWLQELITHEPAAKMHAAWLQAFAARLVELLTCEPEPDEADPIEPAAESSGNAGQRDQGNAANLAADGGTGAAGDEKPSRKSRRRPDHAGTEAERLPGRSARGA